MHEFKNAYPPLLKKCIFWNSRGSLKHILEQQNLKTLENRRFMASHAFIFSSWPPKNILTLPFLFPLFFPSFCRFHSIKLWFLFPLFCLPILHVLNTILFFLCENTEKMKRLNTMEVVWNNFVYNFLIYIYKYIYDIYICSACRAAVPVQFFKSLYVFLQRHMWKRTQCGWRMGLHCTWEASRILVDMQETFQSLIVRHCTFKL